MPTLNFLFRFSKVITLLLFICVYQISFGQQLPSNKPVLNSIRIEHPIEITGKLDNPIWQKAEPIELKYEILPGDNTPATYRTTVRTIYDNDKIYFGFECFDDRPEQIRANITDRDKLGQDDYMVILIDTYGEYQKSCEFKVNPYGIQADELSTQHSEDPNVDWIWHSSASINKNGWTAEIAIPFSSISFPNKEEQVWSLGITRNIPRDSRIQNSWTYIDRNIPNYYSQLGLLKGIRNIKPGSHIELLPYAIGQRMGLLANPANLNSGIKYNPFEGRIGGGIKYSPSSDLTIDAVINPDFSQIESDASQISVNTTFALQYEEKRPFFLAGGELLHSPMYYSRSINDPIGAARVLGKSGGLSYLLLSAYDRNTVFVVPGEESSNTVGTNFNSFANIGKLRYEFGNEAYVSAMLFTRNLENAYNYVAGIDWNYRFWTNWSFSGEAFLSKTKELNDKSLLNSTRKFGTSNYDAALNGEVYSGNGIHLYLSHRQRSVGFTFTINSFSPTYQTYNGSFGQTGYNQLFMSQSYYLYPQDSFLERGSLILQTNLRWSYDGKRREQVMQPTLSFTFKGQTNVNATYLLVNNEEFRGKLFQKINRTMLYINSAPISELSFVTSAAIGKFIYRSIVPTLGNGHTLNFSLTLKPTSQLNIQFDYSRARLSDTETSSLLYDGNIYRAVGIYQFTSEIFFRTIFEYNTFSSSFQFYPLFSYKMNAFTTFYAGATSDYFDSRDDVFGIINTGQQYFLKVQYLFGL